jgi:hypothetical protein
VDTLYRLLQERGERLPEGGSWLRPGGDDDGDGRGDYDDPLPFDRDNNSVPDRLQPPRFTAKAEPFGRRVLVADFSSDQVAIVAAAANDCLAVIRRKQMTFPGRSAARIIRPNATAARPFNECPLFGSLAYPTHHRHGEE